MARQTVNIGSAPNDGTGDPLRVAYDKLNDNFLEIYDDGGANIIVNNPVTLTETTLDVALADIEAGSGGGAVDSVNSDTGAVIVDLESVLNEGNESTLGQGIQSLIIKGGDTYRDLVDDEMSIVTFGTASSVREIGFGWLDDSIAFRKDYESGVGGVYKLLSTNGGVRNISFTPDIKTTSFTAVNENNYTANGTITVTDPSPTPNTGYIVHVIGGSVTIGGVGYTTGDLVYRYYDGASWISTNMNANTGVGATQNARATRLELTGNISLPISVGGSVTVIDFDNTVFNVDPTVFTNNGAGTITCTLAGNYLVTTSIVLESPLASAITKSELGIRKNGTNIICATTDDTPIALGNNIRSLTTSTIINLSANDTLQAVVNLFGASATGQGLRLPSLFGTTATQVSNISIERLEVSEFDVDATPTDGSSNAVSSNGVFDALALKVDKTSWVDYSTTSTIVGFSSFTSKVILYKVIDSKLLVVKGLLVGTSNSTLLTFTIPFTSANNVQNIGVAAITNNGAGQANLGFITCASNSNVVQVLRDGQGTTFTASGLKAGSFTLIIELQ